MGYKKSKYNLSESASFQPKQRVEREKSDFEDFINKLLGKIVLTKKVFFGFDENKIVVIITPSLKIAAVVSSPKKLVNEVPVKKGEILDASLLRSWANSNQYDLSFITPTPKLKVKLHDLFGDVMVVDQISESKTHISGNLINEIEKSKLPESIKKWAIDNPEKFAKNIEKVRKLLG
jgi:hypothetical protein